MDSVMAARTYTTSVILPLAASAGMGIRLQVANGISVGLVIAIGLGPVWIASLRRFRGMRAMALHGVAVVVAGAVLTFMDLTRDRSLTQLAVLTFAILTIVGMVGVLLWVREEVGSHRMAAAYGAGLLLNAFASGLDAGNIWKFSLNTPVGILVLSLAALSRKWTHEVLALVVLVAVSSFADQRSGTAMLLLTAIIVIWQRRSGAQQGRRAKPWMTILMLAGVALSVFLMLQALILEGMLGEAAAERSAAQIQTSGSLLTGGRPEIGAAAALITRQVQGYGSGILPSAHDVWAAKVGMNELNYDPNNGYVENYMFGAGFEVHSVLGDLWLRYGLVGAAFALALTAYAGYALAVRISTRTASAVFILLTLQLGWNLLFSPILGSSRTMALTLALAALLIADGSATPAGTIATSKQRAPV